MSRIDPRAAVSPQAQLADDVQVGAFAVIGPDVVVGPGCVIAPHAIVNGPTTLGANNQVFQFASIGDAPQDKKYKGEPTRLTIGDRNVFREYVTVNRGTVTGHGVTRIGSDNLLLAYSHVAHDCILGDNIVLSNVVMLGGHVELGDWVIMSGYSGAHQFSKIGAHAFIGNNTAVTRDVPPYVLATGQPAEPRAVNSEGLKRRGFSEVQIRAIRNAYRVLYRSDLKLDVAVEKLTQMAGEHEVLKPFVEFIGRSTRSLVR
ncbi:MAG: acyl-ACP--UDP-N-acetylglucosamine O-acyltransferase [Nevskiaceae bacterium]|jgi:UDP-N-acetylglucosamine acyltransferase|nr:acyl-ACP--UDP-N-acetylglucosamine O-acyltransferase [Nevskiaceae bacterium]